MNPHIINYSFSSSTQRPSVRPSPIHRLNGTCRQACLDQLCVLLDGWVPAQPIHPSTDVVTSPTTTREIPFVVCNCCAHRLPENVTGILIFNRHSAFARLSVQFARPSCARSLGGWMDGHSVCCAHVASVDGQWRNGTSEPSANHWVMDCFAISTRWRWPRGSCARPRMYRLNSSSCHCVVFLHSSSWSLSRGILVKDGIKIHLEGHAEVRVEGDYDCG